jgi:uncharacterized protein YpmB
MEEKGEAPIYVVEQRDAIEIYAGQNGHVVLKQLDFEGQENIVWIHPDDVDRVIGYMHRAKEEALAIRGSNA